MHSTTPASVLIKATDVADAMRDLGPASWTHCVLGNGSIVSELDTDAREYQERDGVWLEVRGDCLTGPLDGDPREFDPASALRFEGEGS